MPLAHVGGVGDAIGPEQWFRALPVITKYWFGAAVLVTVAANFNIISVMQLFFDWNSIKDHFELWRVLTCFCFIGKFSFDTLIAMYMLVQFSQQYEVGGPFNTGAGGGTADYAFMMMFGTVTILLSYPIVSIIIPLPPIFSRNLIYYVLYVWSKRHPEQLANIWGIPVQAVYLPFAYLALSVLMGNEYMTMLHGLAMGHFYYFLADVVPKVQGKDILHTPQFLIDQYGVGQYQPEPQPRPEMQQQRGPAAAGVAANRPAPGGGGGGHQWGTGGRPLGRG